MSIKSILRNALDSILLVRGLQLVKVNEYKNLISFNGSVFEERSKIAKQKDTIDSIVFSKDRAMQLHAFLVSFIEMTTDAGKVYILYKATSDRHKKSYNDLISHFKDEEFVFIEENNFKRQLIEIYEDSNSKTIGLYVDDMIFLNPIDYNAISNINYLNYIVSLSRGENFVFSQVLNKKLIPPEFVKLNNGFTCFNWNSSNEYSDWTYPLGVSGYFYDRVEFLVMIRSIDFIAPNSLEGNLQIYLPLFQFRFGLCMESISCVAVSANIVQSEWTNPILGSFSVEMLLLNWEKGLCIDTTKFYFKDGQLAQYQDYEFIPRSW